MFGIILTNIPLATDVSDFITIAIMLRLNVFRLPIIGIIFARIPWVLPANEFKHDLKNSTCLQLSLLGA